MTTLPRPGPMDTLDGPGTELDLLWDQMADVVEATEAVANNAMPNTATAAGALIAGAPAKTTPVDADLLGLSDSAASGVLKQLSWANLKTVLSTIFAVLSGKSGGQTLYGGDSSGENLTLRSTAHATKGMVVLGSLSGYDETNDRLGLGTLAPAARMHAIATTEQARLGYNTSQYAGFTVDSTGILLISPTSGEVDIATSSATATLGAELLTTNPSFASDLSGWTDSGSTWSWHASGAAEHTAGSASNLSQNVTVSSGSTYQIVVTISGRTAGSISCTLGAVGVIESGTATAFTTSFSRTAIAGATGSVAFTITPTTDFNGRIDDVSIKNVTLGSCPVAVNLIQGGAVAAAVRVSSALDNLSLGRESGRSITSGANNLNVGPYAGRSSTTCSFNTNLGVYAGYSVTTGSNNTNCGIKAGRNITTGFYNSNFGAYSGYSLTTGSSNVNCGNSSGYGITTGIGNSNVGTLSGINITSGSNNSNFGGNAGYGITTTNQNATFGYNAGRNISDGVTSLTTPSNCVYIGASTKASADGVTAENVLGYNATGLGSNTVAIGDLNVTRTGLRGSVEILASSSTTASQIQGSLSASWVDSTHATRKARLVISAYDTAAREAIRIEGSGTASLLGFFGASAVAKPAALTATVAAAPDGGTGTAAGAWDTAGNRDLAIATINNLKTRVDQLESKLKALGLLT